MDIAFDAATAGGTGTTSFSHTCTGTNRILLVAVNYIGGTPTVTYNGVSMTNSHTLAATSGYSTKLFYLVNPTAGANTVSISAGGGTIYGAIAGSWTGVAQTGFPDSSNTGNGSVDVTPVTTNTTVVANNCWLVGVSSISASSGAATHTTNRTERVSGAFDGASTTRNMKFVDSNGTVTTGSQSLSSSQSAAASPAYLWNIALSLAPGTDPQPAVTSNVPSYIFQIKDHVISY